MSVNEVQKQNVFVFTGQKVLGLIFEVAVWVFTIVHLSQQVTQGELVL